jgi:hypothetical protein
VDWRTRTVKGHQYDHLLLQPLTRLENLNVAMDSLAKCFWHLMVDPLSNNLLPSAPLHPIHREGWQVWNGDTKFTRSTNTSLYTCVQDPQTQFFWRRKEFFPTPVVPLIVWDTTATAMTRLRQRERQWVTKTASENCGVGTTLVEWKFQDTAHYPRCGFHTELNPQLMCHNVKLKALINASRNPFATFISTFKKKKTNPILQRAILHGLNHIKIQYIVSLQIFNKQFRTNPPLDGKTS